MPRNEEGEFELVLGNRQLLSVFFIVVVLLGVFFVMGYILGKNSSPIGGTDVASVGKPPEPAPGSSPIIIDKSNSKSSATDTPKPETPKPEPAKPEPPKPEPKKTEVAKAEPPKAEPKRPEPAPTRTASGGDAKVGVPPTGSLFLQVAAVGRAEADVVARVLKGKGYELWIAPTEKETVHRVLVGPLQKSDMGKVRGELEGLGFKPFQRTY